MVARIAICLAVLSGLSSLVTSSSPSPALLAAGLVLAAAVVVCLTGRGALHLNVLGGSGPAGAVGSDERRRGSFRRQSHPATPGRPLPRAPQAA